MQPPPASGSPVLPHPLHHHLNAPSLHTRSHALHANHTRSALSTNPVQSVSSSSPSHLQSTSLVPPPPPPPRLSIAAFSSAIAAAVRHPPSRRRPTLHLAVVVAAGSTPAPLLQHANCALMSLTAKGIHVFLQTEIEHLPSHSIAPITHDTVPDLIAASTADYLVLVSDRNLHPPTVQLRVVSHADFVDVPLAEIPHVVLDAWDQRIRRVNDRLLTASLAVNPNVINSRHIHLFLHSFARLPPIHATFAKLTRLVNITQRWEDVSLLPSKSSDPCVPLSRTTSESCDSSNPNPSADEVESQDEVDDSKYASSTATQAVLPPLPAHVADKCVHAAWKMLTNPSEDVNRKQTPAKRDLSYSWLRRSQQVSALLIRSQFMARYVHRNLLTAFNLISKMPISSSSSTPLSQTHLPTAGHRQRLLREINDLMSRIEQLAVELRKRPKIPRRRRRHFIESNPWFSYIDNVKASATTSGVAGAGGRVSELINNGGWQCIACRTWTEQLRPDCSACGYQHHTVDTSQLPTNSERFRKRFEEHLENAHVSPPWIFAPSTVPSLPPLHVAHQVNDLLQRETQSHGGPGPSARTDDMFFNAPDLTLEAHNNTAHNATNEDGRSIDESRTQGVFDLNGAFQGLSFNPDYSADITTNPQPSSSLFNTEGFAGNDSSISSYKLASSAPNSVPVMNFTQRRPHNSRPSVLPIMPQSLNGRSNGRPNEQSLSNNDGFASGLTDPSGPLSSSVPQGFPADNFLLRGAGMLHSDVGSSNLFNDVHTSQKTRGTHSIAMEELAADSYETTDDHHRPNGFGRHTSSNPIAVPGPWNYPDTSNSKVTSLEALAAASDAANGGTGSATKESLRAVSALVTPNRNANSTPRSQQTRSGMYNMF